MKTLNLLFLSSCLLLIFICQKCVTSFAWSTSTSTKQTQVTQFLSKFVPERTNSYYFSCYNNKLPSVKRFAVSTKSDSDLSSSSSDSATTADDKESSPIQQKQLLKGAVCLVTGASRGIGKGIALELGKAGATVYITGTTSSTLEANKPSSSTPNQNNDSGSSGTDQYVSNLEVGGPETIEETAQAVTDAGGKGIPCYCNHAVDQDVQNVIDLIEKEHGKLDLLVNNAFRLPRGGVEKLYKPFWEQGPQTWDVLHTVGLRSHFVTTCFALPLLKKSCDPNIRAPGLPRPFIAMISSFGGLAYTFNVPYGVGKAGVDRLAKDMAVELTPLDIAVSSFWPGLVYTERTKTSVEKGDWDKHVGLPLEFAETPQFTGRAIIAVATDANNIINKTGKYHVVAELAEEYGFVDLNGRRPPSIRSLKFLLPSYGMTAEQRKMIPSWIIPDLKLPFWVMQQGQPPKRDRQ